jgi:hypothetical protein
MSPMWYRETSKHPFVCEAAPAHDAPQQHLYKALQELTKINTSITIPHDLDKKTSNQLQEHSKTFIKSPQKMQPTTTGTKCKSMHHRNILGWGNFCCSYISKYSIKTQDVSCSTRHTDRNPKKMYKFPPKLAARYSPITQVPLDPQIKISATYFQDWMKGIMHKSYYYYSVTPGTIYPWER